ncbi:hypothetical protein [Bowmanella denitrificans]|uniref:hypothetical protein n=1 Tax=Bowmanella denitrificans TaxID=366582 RepID=UPI000C99928E|nr:hypothetical protein [Bowmanella denitrificans]
MRGNAILFCSVLLSACQGTAMQMVPAVITNPSAEVKAELQQVIQQAIGVAATPMLETALTDSHKLLLERQALRDTQGRLLNGRHNEPPLVFELYLSSGICQLVQVGSEQSFALKQAKCRPLATSDKE